MTRREIGSWFIKHLFSLIFKNKYINTFPFHANIPTATSVRKHRSSITLTLTKRSPPWLRWSKVQQQTVSARCQREGSFFSTFFIIKTLPNESRVSESEQKVGTHKTNKVQTCDRVAGLRQSDGYDWCLSDKLSRFWRLRSVRLSTFGFPTALECDASETWQHKGRFTGRSQKKTEQKRNTSVSVSSGRFVLISQRMRTASTRWQQSIWF